MLGAELIVTLAPTAVSVAVLGVLDVPSGTGEEKVKFAGLKLNPAPVPERVAGTARAVPLLVNPREPVVLPAPLGVKVTLKGTLCPLCTVNGKAGIPVRPNPAPLSESAVTITLPPTAVRVPD